MPVEIPLSGGQVALVDDVDEELLDYDWWVNSRGYVVTKTHGWRRRFLRLHRAVMERAAGRRLRRKERVDHVDGNKLDCRRDNLRLASHAENMRNRGPNGSRQYKGVYRSQSEKVGWVAKITYRRRQIYLGTFPSPEAAARAYDEACRRLHGEYARPNFEGAT